MERVVRTCHVLSAVPGVVVSCCEASVLGWALQCIFFIYSGVGVLAGRGGRIHLLLQFTYSLNVNEATYICYRTFSAVYLIYKN